MNNKWDALYSHPKWFAKRIEILERDKWACTVCGYNKLLRVHHTFYYIDYIPPWDYPNKSLLTLCDKCHYDWHLHHEIEYRKTPILKKRKYGNILPPMSLAKKVEYNKREKLRRKKHIRIKGKLYKL